jgi:hypothetical protein
VRKVIDVQKIDRVLFQIFNRQTSCFPIQREDYIKLQSVMRRGLQLVAIVKI